MNGPDETSSPEGPDSGHLRGRRGLRRAEDTAPGQRSPSNSGGWFGWRRSAAREASGPPEPHPAPRGESGSGLREVTAPNDAVPLEDPQSPPIARWTFGDLRRAARRTPHTAAGPEASGSAEPFGPGRDGPSDRPASAPLRGTPDRNAGPLPDGAHPWEGSPGKGPGRGTTPLWGTPAAGPMTRGSGEDEGPSRAPSDPPRGRPRFAPAPPPSGPPTGFVPPGGPWPAVQPPRPPGPPPVPPMPGGHVPQGHLPPPAPAGPVRFLPPTGPGSPPPHPPGATVPRPSARPAPEPDVTTGTHRLHWATIPFQALVFVLVFLAVPGVVLVEFGWGFVLMLSLTVAFGAAAYALAAWWNVTFGLRDDHLVVHTGVFRRLSREIPLSRLQAVDVVRPLLMQVMGLAELRVELAGGDSSEIRLRYLGRGTAERLRAVLLAHAAGLSGRTPEAPEWPFYKLPFGLLLGALAFRLPVLGAFVLLLLLLVTGLAFGELGVLGGAVPLLLGLMRGFLGPLLRYTDFYASLSPDGLRLRYGVFQARMQTVPPGRVQAVRIVEPLLWRSLGVVRVEANVAGYVGERQMDSSTLLPVVPRRLAFALVNEVFPGTDLAGAVLHPAKPGGLPGAALGVDDRVFVTRSGLLCRVIDVVPHARTQVLRMTVGPVERLRGTATVEADTPPGPVRARATGRDVAEARRVIDGVARRAHTARSTTAGPERWATRGDLFG
ncbi:hypothetical protein GCM10027294_33250 [Marinactinospora endophytica]